MVSRLGVFGALFSLLALLAAGGTSAAVGSSTPLPPVADLVLATAEFGPGTTVVSERATKLGGQQLFVRVVSVPARGGLPRSLGVGLAIPERDADGAATDFGVMRTEVGLRTGRAVFAQVFSASIVQGWNRSSHGEKLIVDKTVVGQPVRLGPAAFRIPITFETEKGTMRVAIGIVQVDRVLGVVELLWESEKLPTGRIGAAMSALQRRLRTAFTVGNTSAPTISGTARQGQALALDEGAWTGAPSTFAYGWSRCDARGKACTPIPGATADTYVPVTADTGATLRVAVTGSNTVSSQHASSEPTPAIA
jgi:hypothetical protein